MASRRLLGRMSIQFRSMKSRHSARLASPYTRRQPAGMSVKIGHRLCCSSSLTSTKKVPVSSSNGLMLIASPDRCVGARAQLGAEHSVREQPEAAEVGESGTLSEPRQGGNEKLWRHIGDGQVIA